MSFSTDASVDETAWREVSPRINCPIPALAESNTGVVELVGGLAVLISPFCAVGQHSIGSNLTCVCIYGAAALTACGRSR